MIVSSASNSSTFTVAIPPDHEIRMTRLFDAPPRLVFEAMTKPEHVKEWWGRLGDGYSVPVCEIDLRVGGRWRFVNRHPKGEAAFHGRFFVGCPRRFYSGQCKNHLTRGYMTFIFLSSGCFPRPLNKRTQNKTHRIDPVQRSNLRVFDAGARFGGRGIYRTPSRSEDPDNAGSR
jgi:hypothetical protein